MQIWFCKFYITFFIIILIQLIDVSCYIMITIASLDSRRNVASLCATKLYFIQSLLLLKCSSSYFMHKNNTTMHKLCFLVVATLLHCEQNCNESTKIFHLSNLPIYIYHNYQREKLHKTGRSQAKTLDRKWTSLINGPASSHLRLTALLRYLSIPFKTHSRNRSVRHLGVNYSAYANA